MTAWIPPSPSSSLAPALLAPRPRKHSRPRLRGPVVLVGNETRAPVRAATAVEGLSAGQGRSRHGVRPRAVLVRRQRRRPPAGRDRDVAGLRGHQVSLSDGESARVREVVARHRISAAATPGARRGPRRCAVPSPAGGQRPHQGSIRRRIAAVLSSSVPAGSDWRRRRPAREAGQRRGDRRAIRAAAVAGTGTGDGAGLR